MDRNVERDRNAEAALLAQGWRTLTIWECEVGELGALAHRVRAFLDD
jgi:DNA mismatch endonuclease (patch repair protein)